MFEGLMLKILCASLLCMAAMLLAGSGPAAEPVRLACAAFTVVFVFSLFDGGIPKLPDISEYRNIVENAVDAQSAAVREETAAVIAEETESKLFEMFGKEAELEYFLDGELFCVKSVTFFCEEEQKLAEAAAELVGIGRESVIFSPGS